MGLYDGYDISSLSLEEINQIYRDEHDRITKAHYVDGTMNDSDFQTQHRQIWIDRCRALIADDRSDDLVGLELDVLSALFNEIERCHLLESTHPRYLERNEAINRIKFLIPSYLSQIFTDLDIDDSTANYSWIDTLISQVEVKIVDCKDGIISIEDLYAYRRSFSTSNVLVSFLKGLME